MTRDPSPTTTGSALSVRGLRKSFAGRTVLDGVDLDLPGGGVLALLGPNGAGKTTTVRILSTVLGADDGELRVAGHDVRREPAAVRDAIGVTGQFSAVDDLLTGEENLRLMADLRHLSRRDGRRRVAELLARFDLEDAAARRAATYSGGMRRRLDLAMTLVGRPSVVFLDEPTTGLDPRSRRTTWAMVRDLVADGVAVLLTTQYLEEADQLADRIAVIDGGRVVAEGTAEELKARMPDGHVRVGFADAPALRAAAGALPEAAVDEPGLALRVAGTGVPIVHDALERLRAAGVDGTSLAVRTPDLDDVFLALTERPATGREEVAA